MKTFKIALAMLAAALMALALLASPSSAAIGTDDQATVSGSLYQMTPGTTTKITGPFDAGQQIRLNANFPDGVRDVNFYRETTPGSNTWTLIDTDESNSSGNAYVNYTVAEGTTKIFAEDEDDLETETDDIVGEPGPAPPAPGTAVLNTPTNGGKTFTATFAPAASGQTTRLEVQRIYTAETNETDAENPEAAKKDRVGPWESIATGKQNSSGSTTFTISKALLVKHKYRALSGSTTSDVIEYAGHQFPAPNPYGINTGLSQVHFNTYEGDSVNTRDRYFEGEFSMTQSSKLSECQAVAPIKYSEMKGRGNYSWSFPKKSFTLKIDKKTDLCGLGVSKKYALVANDYDKSLLRNTLAQFVGSKFSNMGWTPQSAPVDLYMNGDFRGSYILIERISIQGSKTDASYSNRMNLDELKDEGQTTDSNHENNVQPNVTGGYVLEWDYRKGADYNAYLGSDSGYVGVKDPENDLDRENQKTTEGISSQQKSYISNYLNQADSAMRRSTCQSSDWEDFIDKASAVDYYIAMEYMKPVDGNMWASVNMYKPRGEKIHFGPMWDFDMAAGSANRAGNVVSSQSFYLRNNLGVSAQQSSNTWFNCLNKRQSFRNAVAARWDQVLGGTSFNVSAFIDEQSALIAKSAEANFKKWSYSSSISKYQVKKGSWSKDVTYVRGWASGRKNFLSGSNGF